MLSYPDPPIMCDETSLTINTDRHPVIINKSNRQEEHAFETDSVLRVKLKEVEGVSLRAAVVAD